MQTQVPYQQAINRKYPEQIAYAIAKDPKGHYNPISLGWIMQTSHEPPMLAISVGLARYSYEVIREAKQFTITFPSTNDADEVLFFGTKSGREMDKITEFNSEIQSATEIDSVLLTNAVANFECELVSETVTGDHAIFVGRVVASHVNKDENLKRIFTLATDWKFGGVS